MDKRFGERMDNWRRVVRSGQRRGTCAAWARLYVASRIEAFDTPRAPQLVPDELDGWVVEALWARLPRWSEKMVLKYWHVTHLSEAAICVRLRMRPREVRLLRERAEINFSKALDKFDRLATIAANNLKAGNFPRILTLPVAGSMPPKDSEALIE